MDQFIMTMPLPPDHPLLEQLSWVAQVFLALAACVGIFFGVRQLKDLKEQGELRIKQMEMQNKQLQSSNLQMKATFLFELDKMFESEPVAKARTSFVTLWKEVEDHVKNTHPHQETPAREASISEEFSKRLYDLREGNLEAYTRLMTLCGFFETAGMLVHRGYTNKADIEGLYDGSIHHIYTAMKRHIQRRQEEMPPGFYENFRRLAESIPPRSSGN